MSRYVHPYRGARVLARAAGPIPEGPHAGQPVEVTLWDGLASSGYRSGYERRPRAWLVIEAPAVKVERGRPYRFCWTFSGGRYERARSEFDRAVSDLSLTVQPHPAPQDAPSAPPRPAPAPVVEPVPESPPPDDLGDDARARRAAIARALAEQVRAGVALPAAGSLLPEPEPIPEEPDEPHTPEPSAEQLDLELSQLRLL